MIQIHLFASFAFTQPLAHYI